MSLNVTDAEVRDHDKLLQTYRDKRTRCVHCEQLIMDWHAARPLPCLHVLCSEQCLIANKIDNVFDCPTCHLSVDENCLATWRSIGLALFRKEALLTCTHCVDKVSAIYWCAQCPDSLCQPCREFHQKCVMFAKHTVTLFDPNGILDPKNGEVVCEKHNEKTVKYCMTCNEALCSSPHCYRPHSNHELKSIKDFVKEFRSKIQKGGQNMRGFLARAYPLMNSINDGISKTLDLQTNSGILNLFGTEFKRIVDLVAHSEVLLKGRESLKNFKVKSLRSQVSQFLHAIGDTTGISNENITQNYRILNDHFEEIEEGIAVCSDVKDDDDTIVKDYLPAFQQVTDILELLIKVLSSERSQRFQILTKFNSPFSSGIQNSQLAGTAENGEETNPTSVAGFSGNSVAGFSGNAAKVRTTPKVSKNQKDVDIEMEIIEDISSESEEDDERDGGRSQKAEKKVTRAAGETMAVAAATNHSPSPPHKTGSRNKSPSEQSDTFSYETHRSHTRKRPNESLVEKRPISAARTRSKILSPDAKVRETASTRSSKSPVCVRKVGPSPSETKEGKAERSESGRDEGGPSTSRSQSPNKRKNLRRWSQGNDELLKSHENVNPSTPAPTVAATAATFTSADDVDDIGSGSGSRDESTLPIKKRRLDESSKTIRTLMKKPSTNSPHNSPVLTNRNPNFSSQEKSAEPTYISGLHHSNQTLERIVAQGSSEESLGPTISEVGIETDASGSSMDSDSSDDDEPGPSSGKTNSLTKSKRPRRYRTAEVRREEGFEYVAVGETVAKGSRAWKVPNKYTESAYKEIKEEEDKMTLKIIPVPMFISVFTSYEDLNKELLKLYGLSKQKLLKLYGLSKPKLCCAVCPHNGIKAFQCYSAKREYRKHWENIHESPWECSHCNRQFRTRPRFNYHINKYHVNSENEVDNEPVAGPSSKNKKKPNENGRAEISIQKRKKVSKKIETAKSGSSRNLRARKQYKTRKQISYKDNTDSATSEEDKASDES